MSVFPDDIFAADPLALIDAKMGAGYHSIVWNANSLSSSIYFVKMVVGEYVGTQKLMLVK